MDNYLIAKATDIGASREINEDSMTVFDSPNGQVLVVCDGMGGQAAGDVASQLAVNIIENILTDNTFDTPEEAIRRSVIAANQGVLNKTAQNPELEGMGATCVMLIIKDGRVHCGWVGDSRIYYIANHTIRQISHDQSYVQQLIDSGQITKDEAANHPQKSEITNCIGLQGMTAPETVAVPIVPEPGSTFLLCSDGLSGMVDERQIERTISNTNMSLQQKADKLIAMANEAGGLDNITVELVQFGTSEVAGATSGTLFETPKDMNLSQKKSHKLLYSIICILILAALCIGGGYYYMSQKQKEEAKKVKVDKKGNTTSPSGTGSKFDNHSTPPVAPIPPAQKAPTNKSTSPVNSLKQNAKKGNGVEKAIDNASKKNNQKPNVLQEKPKESDAPKVDEQALKELQEEMKTKD
jgi:protein phosphatase